MEEQCGIISKKTFIALLVSGGGFMMIFIVTSPEIFSDVLSNNWLIGQSNRTEQRLFSHPSYLSHNSTKRQSHNGTILLWTFNYVTKMMGLDGTQSRHFNCGRYQCEVTKDRSKLKDSGVIVFEPRSSRKTNFPSTKEPWQRWVVQTRESPVHEKIPKYFDGKANWTFDYSSQADISWQWGIAMPRGDFDALPFYSEYFYDTSNNYAKQLEDSRQDIYKENYRDLLKYKTKQLMWLVSNCGIRERNQYAQALSNNGLKLDKYGRCGKPFPCKRDSECEESIFLHYKFYIAFENSHCEDYITEKLWKSLYRGMVPIVMGPSIANYEKYLPPDSFLHVKNFSSPTKLAEYIKYLDNNDEAYVRYHAWRANYRVLFLNSNNFLWVCDMCKKMHDPPKPAHKNLSGNWRPQVKCNN